MGGGSCFFRDPTAEEAKSAEGNFGCDARMRRLPIIAITLGDAGGIGPEIILKASQEKELLGICRPLVIGDWRILEETARRLDLPFELERLSGVFPESWPRGKMAVFDLANLDFRKILMGKPSSITGKAAVECIFKAVELILAGKVQGMTTGPLNKEGMHLAGYHYPGHTELLAELTRSPEHAMMLVGGEWRVSLVTTHLPLKEVSSSLSWERVLRTIRLTHSFLPFLGVDKPRIAVAALNPHGGEGGLFGREEIEHIAPAVRQAQEMGLEASGPYPADTLFQPRRAGEFHAIVVMYHDQGMIPVKMAAFGQAVNVTLGLSIVRTSVDHGTAYDIAGKGVASPSSLLAAIRLAAVLSSSVRQKADPC